MLGTMAVLLAGCSGPAHAHQRIGPAGPGSAAPGASSSPSPSAPSVDADGVPHFPAPPAPRPVTVPPGPKAGWFSAIPTDQPIAFITIDDGWTKTPEALGLLKAANVPVTLFLEIKAIKSDVGYFRALQQAGAVIEAHTISHPELKGKPYAFQKHQICASADQLGAWYGRRPVLFRPPFGDKDDNTLRAVHDCGMKAAFFWTEATDHGKVFFQEGHTVQPGVIILMHFRPRFVDDFLAVLKAIHKAGLTQARLEDYIP
jgi:peptidoglycan/xylan/chitin deacetylase (PgdA/CDA1 family)